MVPKRSVFARDGMPVRTRRGLFEITCEMALDHRRYRMLEAARFGACRFPRDAEVIDEKTFCKALPAERECADQGAGRGRCNPMPALMRDISLGVEPLQHRGRRR